MMPERHWTFEEVEALYRQFNPAAIDGEGKKVLVADDMVQIRTLLANALTQKGFTVFTAENGLQALNLIRKEMPDCCLLDIMMPQLSGFDLLEILRKDPRYAAIPVVMVTARKEKRDILTAQRLGAAGYILKPFQLEDVLKRVQEICTQ
jgi:CheY-like chemotaxis protein